MRGANKRGFFFLKSLGQHCTVLLPLLFRFRDSYSTTAVVLDLEPNYMY
eukprot:COSAG01_NODE_4505_length_4961_cov_5.384805_1_plen_49_part_10